MTVPMAVLTIILAAVCLCGTVQSLPTKTAHKDKPANWVVQPNTVENLATIASGDYPQNIEELSGQFEGDMILSTEQKLLVKGQQQLPIDGGESDHQRTGLRDKRFRWPGAVVPVVLTEDHFDAEHTAHIYKSLRALEAVSCVRFVNWTTEENYVRVFSNNSGCYSNVGFQEEGEQEVNLQLMPIEVGCFRQGTIMHEFLHTLGFFHMQSATERDDWVRIAWENLTPGTEDNFEKYEYDEITNFGQSYDVTSIMHYGAYGFSKNGYATIIPNDITLIDILGQRVALTPSDIARLNNMYYCNNND